MKIQEINILNGKAKERKDGVYHFRGNWWIVKNNRFIAFADYSGKVFQRFGSFNTQIGDLSTVESWNRKKKLIEWLKTQ
jgi:hypothetical protein